MNKIRIFGEYTFEFDPMVLTKGIDVITLASKQLETLAVLLDADGAIVTKEAFLEKVWGDVIVEEHNLTQTIFLLRRALGKLPNGQEYIETIPRRGYRLSILALQPRVERLATDTEAGGASAEAKPVGAPVLQDASMRPRFGQISKHRYGGVIGFASLILAAIGASVTLISERQHPVIVRSQLLTRDGMLKDISAPLFLKNARLYFNESLHDESYLASVSIYGGVVTRQQLPGSFAKVVGIHPLRDEEIVASTPLFSFGLPPSLEAMSSFDDTYHLLGDAAGESAAWSSDGKRLVYITGKTLFLADGDGEDSKALATLSGTAFWPVWSPDGKSVRFSMNEGGLLQSIWEIDLASHAIHALKVSKANLHHVCCGSWSGDGRYFTYIAGNSKSSSIWIQKNASNLLGTSSRAREWSVASGPVDFWRTPSISSDAKHIFAIGEQVAVQLVAVDEFTRIALDPKLYGLSADSVTYSHDGAWVAYTLYPEGSLWKSHPDGTEKVRLSALDEIVRKPEWSPDDKTLLYLSSSGESGWSVKTLPSDRGQSTTLIEDVYPDSTASYSSSGEQVAFGQQVKSNDSSADKISVGIFNIKSCVTETLPLSSRLTDPHWSPDGKYIAARNIEGKGLMIYDVSLRQWKSISNDDVHDQVWSKRGDKLYFVVHQKNSDSIMRTDVATWQSKKFADISHSRKSAYMNQRLNITAEDKLVVAERAGFSEVYDMQVELP